MFSVIIPTMWRVSEFLNDLRSLNECELVGEIILINNDIKITPDSFSIQNYSKLIEIKTPKNMYVNPAWNLGVRCAKYNKIAIKNDDTFFDYFKTLNAVEKELDTEDSVIGTYLQHDNNIIRTTNEKDIVFNEIPKRDIGFGCCIFLNKQSYIPINEKILIWYGDDFITESYTKRGLKIKTISGINIHGYVSATSATVDHFPELVTMKYEDERLWNDKKETLYKECGL